jgi:solute carrier family 35 protein F5
MIVDVLLKKVEYPYIFYLGSIPMIVAFLIVSLLSHFDNWDPVLDIVKKLYVWIFRRSRSTR